MIHEQENVKRHKVDNLIQDIKLHSHEKHF